MLEGQLIDRPRTRLGWAVGLLQGLLLLVLVSLFLAPDSNSRTTPVLATIHLAASSGQDAVTAAVDALAGGPASSTPPQAAASPVSLVVLGARTASPTSQAFPRLNGHLGVAAEAEAGAARSTNFIVHPNGDVVPVPNGAVGPSAVDSGKGFQFTGGSGGHGLDPRTTDVRIMDPVTTGKYQYPDGYVSYSNGSGQAVNPYTGQTVGKADPWWHWPY